MPARTTLKPEDELARLYDEHAARLFSTASRLLGSRAAAEDCVQELFVTLARNRLRAGEVANVRAYLFTALRHAVGRMASRNRTTPPEPVAPAVPDLEGAHALRQALERLTAAQREVVALKSDGGLTFDEIGAVLQVPPATAASRYRAALAKLHAVLTEEHAS